MPEPDDADPYEVGLRGFQLTDPADPDEVAEHEAAIAEAVQAMGPPRRFTYGPDGSLIEIDVP
ncbi:hypothetical protein [Actinomadura sp. 3N508]|uniref:hypothetical protein n=1 Tax=Actinomadura sp. 3N508 TaxID=3375153 RepID=UPI0037BB359D